MCIWAGLVIPVAFCLFIFSDVTLVLSAVLLTSGLLFRFFRFFANKVELTKADLQGREGFCFPCQFGLKDAFLM